jgi:nucleotide-binding universal stress UspA family protein
MTVTSMGAEVPVPRPSVVVGVDDGILRIRVLDRAVAEARHRDRTVRVVHVHGPVDPPAPWDEDAGERAESYLRRTAPDLDVRRTCASDDPASVLAGACGPSSLVVLGDRHRRLASAAGDTTERLIEWAPCPVLVLGEYSASAPAREGHRHVVVVGLDDSPQAATVLRHAHDAAVRLGEPLEVVRAVEEVVYDADGPIRRREASTADLEDWVASIRVPDVAVSVVVAEDRPARLLLDRARGTDLVVVGHRGPATQDLVGLGSTTRALLLAAPCPVMVLGPRMVTVAGGVRAEVIP